MECSEQYPFAPLNFNFLLTLADWYAYMIAAKRSDLYRRWFYDKKRWFACCDALHNSWRWYSFVLYFASVQVCLVYFLNCRPCIGSIGDSGGEKNYWISRDWWWLEVGKFNSLLLVFLFINLLCCLLFIKKLYIPYYKMVIIFGWIVKKENVTGLITKVRMYTQAIIILQYTLRIIFRMWHVATGFPIFD